MANGLARHSGLREFFLGFPLLLIGSAQSTEPRNPATPGARSLREIATFPVGASVSPSLLLHNDRYRSVLASEFNSITTENALKWTTVHPEPDRFDFSGADSIASFCQSQHARLHGHNLVWYSYNPAWLNRFSGDSAAWARLLQSHIATVMGHFRGRAASWDVVNEAFDGQGRLRDSNCIWAIHLGNDYVAQAFRYARAADPEAKLFYNDYDQESSLAKTEAILNMVRDFARRRVPIDGLGLQMHLRVGTPVEGIARAIRDLAATGLLIHVSELDISVNPGRNPGLTYGSELQERQAQLYYEVVHLYRTLVPRSQQWGISTWNVGDADSWLRFRNGKDWPLLFDSSYRKKTTYAAFVRGLTQ